MLKSSLEVALEAPPSYIKGVEILGDLLAWRYIDDCRILKVWNWKEKRLLLVSRTPITLTMILTPRQFIADNRRSEEIGRAHV